MNTELLLALVDLGGKVLDFVSALVHKGPTHPDTDAAHGALFAHFGATLHHVRAAAAEHPGGPGALVDEVTGALLGHPAIAQGIHAHATGAMGLVDPTTLDPFHDFATGASPTGPVHSLTEAQPAQPSTQAPQPTPAAPVAPPTPAMESAGPAGDAGPAIVAPPSSTSGAPSDGPPTLPTPPSGTQTAPPDVTPSAPVLPDEPTADTGTNPAPAPSTPTDTD